MTAEWIVATAPECPRAKAARSARADSASPEPLAQRGDRAFFELDHPPHGDRSWHAQG